MSIKGTSKGGGRGKSEKSLANLKGAKKVETETKDIKTESIKASDKKSVNALIQDFFKAKDENIEKQIIQDSKDLIESASKDIAEKEYIDRYDNKKQGAFGINTVFELKGNRQVTDTMLDKMKQDGTYESFMKDLLYNKSKKEMTKRLNSSIKQKEKERKANEKQYSYPTEIGLNELRITKETEKAIGFSVKTTYYNHTKEEYITKRQTAWIPKSFFTNGKVEMSTIRKKIREFDYEYNGRTRRYELDID